MSYEDRHEQQTRHMTASRRKLTDESGIIVFGGGGRGCSARGCLFWIIVSVVLSVGLTILVNLILLLFSGSGTGANV